MSKRISVLKRQANGRGKFLILARLKNVIGKL